MKYQKGTFVVIPNKHILSGLDPLAQVLFFWICSYSDDDGICFPSFFRLMKDTGMSKRSIINKLEVLEKAKIIVRKRRKTSEGLNFSNEYQIVVLSGAGDAPRSASRAPRSAGDAPAVVHHVHQGGAPRALRTISKELYPIELNKEGPGPSGEKSFVKKPPREPPKKKFNPLGAEVLKAFEEVDPKNKTYYNNTSQRAACDFLIEEYSLEETFKRIQALKITNKQSFFPNITTPVQLRDKWVPLQDAVDRYRSERKSKNKLAF